MSWFSDIGDAIGNAGAWIGQEVNQAADYVAPALPTILNAAAVVAPFTGIGAIAAPFLGLASKAIAQNQLPSVRPPVAPAVMPSVLQAASQASFQPQQNNLAQIQNTNPIQNAVFGNSTPYASASSFTSGTSQGSQQSTNMQSVGFFDNVKSFFANNPWYVILGVVVIPFALALYLLFRLFKRKR